MSEYLEKALAHEVEVVQYLSKRIRELEAERDQWQESSGQNYVRAQDAEAREEGLREAMTHYMRCHDRLGGDHIKTGRAWDVMRRLLENTDGQ